jgi:hypothetical protein
MLQKSIVDGLPMLSCSHGHVICVDSSAQMTALAHQIGGIVTALAAHMQSVEKSIVDLKKAVENSSAPKP